jgi:probable F420-dependent oxidoreductase
MSDDVVMGYPIEGCPPGPYQPTMPILEALMTLAHVAGLTSRIGLGTEVLVPPGGPTLVAKQVSTLDTLSGGRVRLGIGVGWQGAGKTLGGDFHSRGARMDEAIALLRAYWGDARVDFEGTRYRATAMSMEPKPPHGRRLPLWIGGSSEAADHRVGRFGDGWMESRVSDAESTGRAIELIHRHAENAGRDPRAIGLQSMVAPPPRDEDDKRFYAEPDRVVARVAALKAMGFGWAALNATAIFQAGARSVGAMINALATLHARIRAEVG